LFVVGNAYVLQSLYPSNLVEAWDPQLESADSSEFWKRIPTTEERLQIEEKFGTFWKALFTSVQMMFLGEYDAQLMRLSFRPSLAHYNYLYAVVLIPVIMLNLLIALMGGSYERSQESSKNEGMKQRAGILNDYEVQMGKLERANRAMFPDWFAYFRIKQSEEVTPTEIGGGRGDGGADLAQLSKDMFSRFEELEASQSEANAETDALIQTHTQDFGHRIEHVEAELKSCQAAVLEQQAALMGKLEEVITRLS